MEPTHATWLGGPDDGKTIVINSDVVCVVVSNGPPPVIDFENELPPAACMSSYREMHYPVRRLFNGRFVICYREAR